MRDRLFTAASVVSLLICLAMSALWVRSVWWKDELSWSHRPSPTSHVTNAGEPDVLFAIRCECGQLTIVLARFEPQYWIAGDGRFHQAHAVPMRWNFAPDWDKPLRTNSLRWGLGFHYSKNEDGTGEIDKYIGIPLWCGVAVAVILPLIWGVRSRTRPKHHAYCRCGYDLTGNTSGVCPECGAACKAPDPANASPAVGD